jgi:tyrosyl-tRNA synthetase
MHEIMYPILQGYDSVAINSDIELGATEQKFNILCGRDMQRIFGMEQQIAVLSPILIGTDGINKMSKSMNNYIAVFDTPNDKFGKVMSIPDNLILNYFNYATKLDPDEIEVIKKELEKGVNPMVYKKQLAREIVKLYHGEEASVEAQSAFEKVFSKKELPDDMPVITISEDKVKFVKLLVENELCASNSEAKRMIQQNAVTVNGEKWTDFEGDLTIADGMVIKVGKRKFLQIKKG